MTSTKFYVQEHGRASEGRMPALHVVTFETGIVDDQDWIDSCKAMLAELFDVSTRQVFTKTEWDKQDVYEDA